MGAQMNAERPERANLQEFLQKAKRVSDQLNYPIVDTEQLAEALGGHEAKVAWGGRRHKVSQAVKVVPDYYFPIESEEDLLVKAVNLELFRPGTRIAPLKMARERKEKSADKRPPRSIQKLGLRVTGKSIEGGPAIVVGERRTTNP
jgi:hypothetical protein